MIVGASDNNDNNAFQSIVYKWKSYPNQEAAYVQIENGHHVLAEQRRRRGGCSRWHDRREQKHSVLNCRGKRPSKKNKTLVGPSDHKLTRHKDTVNQDKIRRISRSSYS